MGKMNEIIPRHQLINIRLLNNYHCQPVEIESTGVYDKSTAPY